jgi:hypothetical protein
MTGSNALVYPVLVQLLWTFVLVTCAGTMRVRALRSRRVRFKDIALSGDAYPDEVRKIGNNMHNQFETPILFYVLCGLAIYVGATNALTVLLAWFYVATRVVHTAVHTTTNRVDRRFFVFLAGVIALIAMWVAIVARLAVS